MEKPLTNDTKPGIDDGADATDPLERLRAAADKLEPRYWHWMIDTLLRHEQEELAKKELEIMRHERFINEPCEGRLTLKTTRKERIDDLFERLDAHRRILAFLIEASKAYRELESERFAAELRASGYRPPGWMRASKKRGGK